MTPNMPRYSFVYLKDEKGNIDLENEKYAEETEQDKKLHFKYTNEYRAMFGVVWGGKCFYAANIPVIDDRSRAERCFQHGLKFLVKSGVRPHILYGSSESNRGWNPKNPPTIAEYILRKIEPHVGSLYYIHRQSKGRRAVQ